MVERLARSPASVSELARPLAMSLPAVMQHLAVLEGSGLVVSEKIGRVRTCRIEPAALGLAENGSTPAAPSGSSRLDRLGDYLEELKSKETTMAHTNEAKTGVKPEPLVISRTFPAPRELVFKAWSSAEHMKRWFSPEGYTVPEAEIDFRPGGVCAICMRSPDGQDFWSQRHISSRSSPPDRLVFTSGVAIGGGRQIHRPHHRHLRGRRRRDPHDRAAGL